jgi:hypothetical protein
MSVRAATLMEAEVEMARGADAARAVGFGGSGSDGGDGTTLRNAGGLRRPGRGGGAGTAPHPPAPPEAVRAERSLGPASASAGGGFRSGRRAGGRAGRGAVARERDASIGSLVPLARRHDGVTTST